MTRGAAHSALVRAILTELGELEVKTGAATLTGQQRAIHTALRTVGVAVHVVGSVVDGSVAFARLRVGA